MKPETLNPAYYANLSPEPIDVIQGWKLNHCLGCAVKYIARAGNKGDAAEDLSKACWYLMREIRAQEKQVARKPKRKGRKGDA